MMLPVVKQYNSNIRAVGTKIPETIEFLKLYSQHFDISYVREKIVDDNVFNIGNLRTIKNLFATLKSRYAFDNEFYKVKNLTDIANSNLDIEIVKTIIFLYFAQYEYAVFDVMTECIFPLKQNKFNKVNGSTILSFFEEKKDEHPEYCLWSKNSREIFASMMLTSARDFGFLEKKNNKEFIISNRLLPLETVGYLLYYIKQFEENIIKSQYLKLYLITQEELVFYLNELSRAGFLEYSENKDGVEIMFTYNSLDEFIKQIISR